MIEITFVVVTPPGYSLELYINASVENPPRVSSCQLVYCLCKHIGGTSYTDAPGHDKGSDRFFHVDENQYDESCPPDDVVPIR